MSKISYARVRVLIDLNLLKFRENLATFQLRPNLCQSCGRVGHREGDCATAQRHSQFESNQRQRPSLCEGGPWAFHCYPDSGIKFFNIGRREDWEAPKKTSKASGLLLDTTRGDSEVQTQKADCKIRKHSTQSNMDEGIDLDANNYFSPISPASLHLGEEPASEVAPDDPPDGPSALSPILETLASVQVISPIASLPDTGQDSKVGRTTKERKLFS